MRDPSQPSREAIRQAAAVFGRRRYVLTCYGLDGQKFTYDVLADSQAEAIQSCRADNPMEPTPYIIGGIRLHVPITLGQ